MKAAWDQLGGEFAESKTALIGDVDCTVHESVCQKFGVQGYPTIKTFAPGAGADEGEDYQGGRSFDDLKAYADENLGPSCENSKRELCKPEQVAILDKASALSPEELTAALAGFDAEIEAAENEFKEKLSLLQEQYQGLMTTKDEKIAKVRPNIRLYKSVQGSAGDATKSEL